MPVSCASVLLLYYRMKVECKDTAPRQTSTLFSVAICQGYQHNVMNMRVSRTADGTSYQWYIGVCSRSGGCLVPPQAQIYHLTQQYHMAAGGGNKCICCIFTFHHHFWCVWTQWTHLFRRITLNYYCHSDTSRYCLGRYTRISLYKMSVHLIWGNYSILPKLWKMLCLYIILYTYWYRYDFDVSVSKYVITEWSRYLHSSSSLNIDPDRTGSVFTWTAKLVYHWVHI